MKRRKYEYDSKMDNMRQIYRPNQIDYSRPRGRGSGRANYTPRYSNVYHHNIRKPYYNTGPYFSHLNRKLQVSNPNQHHSRPTSPVQGSEEYNMTKKIEHTSAIIMRHLLSPDENMGSTNSNTEEIVPTDAHIQSKSATMRELNYTSRNSRNSNTPKKKKSISYDAEEIHDQIVAHLTNLNDGRKKNLINASTSGYDSAIQQIIKQRRLEISRALRNMCSDSTSHKESSDLINSIIPDIGIKIEELPRELIEELRSTFTLEIETEPIIVESDMDLNLQCESLTAGIQIEELPSKLIEELRSTFSIEIEPDEELMEEPEKDLNVPCEILAKVQHSYQEVLNSSDCFIEDSNIANIKNIKVEPPDNVITTVDSSGFQQTANNFRNILEDEINYGNEKQYVETDVRFEPSSNSLLIREEDIGINSQIDSTENIFRKDLENIGNSLKISKIKVEEVDSNIQDNLLTTPEESMDYTPTSEIRIEERESNIQISEQKTLDSGKSIVLYPSSVETTSIGEANNIGTTNSIMKTNTNGETNNAIINCSGKEKRYMETSVQTETEHTLITVQRLIERNFTGSPESLLEAVERMKKIDVFISELTLYRQSLFSNFIGTETENTSDMYGSIMSNACITMSENKKKRKISEHNEEVVSNPQISNTCVENSKKILVTHKQSVSNPQISNNCVKKARKISRLHKEAQIKSAKVYKPLDRRKKPKATVNLPVTEESVPENDAIEQISWDIGAEKVLIVKVVEDTLVAATETGKIYYYSLSNQHYTNILNVSSLPISCLLIIKENQCRTLMYIGSFDKTLKVYDFYGHQLLKSITLSFDVIQCMDYNWGYIFMGSSSGFIRRYSVKKEAIEYEDKITYDGILALKATVEGARRIIILGSNVLPIIVRDAMTGLHLRTMGKHLCPTVYSVIIEKSRVYCATNDGEILVFSFHQGKLLHVFRVLKSKGIGCMVMVGKLIFISCHSDNIHVYDGESKEFIGKIDGPGGVILSMQISKRWVIVTTTSCKLQSCPIPLQISKKLRQ